MREINFVAAPTDNQNDVPLANLEKVHAGSCDKITCNILNLVPFSKAGDCIRALASRVKYGGTIQFRGPDIYEICRLYYLGHISLGEVNNIILNGASCLSLNYIREILRSINFTVTKSTFSGTNFNIEAKRNENSNTL